MMFRCRFARIALPAFLSLAIVMAFFVLPAYADGSMNAYFTWKYNEDNSTTWTEITRNGLSDGVCTYNPHKYWAVSGITYVHNDCDTDVWFSFNVSGVVMSDPGTTIYYMQNQNADGKIGGTSSSGNFEVWVYQSTTPENPYSNLGFYGIHKSYLFIVHFTYTAGSATGNTSFFSPSGNPRFFTNSAGGRASICPVFSNVTFYHDFSQLLASGILDIGTSVSAIQNLIQTQNNLISSLSGDISNIKDYTGNISSKCNTLFNSSYTWTQLSYNTSSEAIEASQETGNWFDAVLGSIQSISSDAEAQAAQQQKAMDAGAGDALDDVYNSMGSSSFGALSDFTDLTDLGNWNSGSYDTNSSNLLIGWFSQANKNAISNIPQTRDNDIIDFYHQNIIDIEEGVSDGSAD